MVKCKLQFTPGFGGDEGNRTPVLTFFNAQVLQVYPELILKGGTLARTNPF